MGSAQCDLRLAVEVRQCPLLQLGALCWAPREVSDGISDEFRETLSWVNMKRCIKHLCKFHHDLNQRPHWIDDGESKVNDSLLWPNISGE